MNKAKKAKSGWVKTRKLFNDVHLWGGLISGIIVFVVCLTGTIYVYNTELREAALSSYYKVEKEGKKLPVDSLLSMVRPMISGKVTGIRIPFDETASYGVLYTKKKAGGEDGPSGIGSRDRERVAGEVVPKTSSTPAKAGSRGKGKDGEAHRQEGSASTGGEHKAPQGGGRRRSNQMMVNPYTGEALGDPAEEKTKTADFMQTMFGLHRWLLLNEIEGPIIEGIENRKLGSWITGTATLLFLLGVLTGLVIWFPNKIRSWKNGLKVKWSASWKRVNHDLHNTLGLYTWIFLFLMAVTGPFWSFEWYREGWQKAWGTHQSQQIEKGQKSEPLSRYTTESSPMDIQETIAAVNVILPYDGDITINFPKDSVGTLSITKNRVGFFAPSASDKLVLDQYSGDVLEKDLFREKSIRNRIGSSIKALHIGDVYGPFTKLLYFISCLVATSLPVTGVLIWLNKMKKSRKEK